MQAVDVLGDDQHVAGIIPFEPGQRKMRGVGLHLPDRLAPHIVKFVHAGRIARKTFRRGHIAIVNLGPDAVLVAKGRHAGFGMKCRRR
jgi:hypothetical protein